LGRVKESACGRSGCIAVFSILAERSKNNLHSEQVLIGRELVSGPMDSCCASAQHSCSRRDRPKLERLRQPVSRMSKPPGVQRRTTSVSGGRCTGKPRTTAQSRPYNFNLKLIQNVPCYTLPESSRVLVIPGTCVLYPGLQGGGALGDASTPGTPADSIAASAHGGTYNHVAVAGETWGAEKGAAAGTAAAAARRRRATPTGGALTPPRSAPLTAPLDGRPTGAAT